MFYPKTHLLYFHPNLKKIQKKVSVCLKMLDIEAIKRTHFLWQNVSKAIICWRQCFMFLLDLIAVFCLLSSPMPLPKPWGCVPHKAVKMALACIQSMHSCISYRSFFKTIKLNDWTINWRLPFWRIRSGFRRVLFYEDIEIHSIYPGMWLALGSDQKTPLSILADSIGHQIDYQKNGIPIIIDRITCRLHGRQLCAYP